MNKCKLCNKKIPLRQNGKGIIKKDNYKIYCSVKCRNKIGEFIRIKKHIKKYGIENLEKIVEWSCDHNNITNFKIFLKQIK